MTRQDRLAEEHQQLLERLGKLRDFLERDDFETLPNIDQALIRSQYHVMRAYAAILKERRARIERMA